MKNVFSVLAVMALGTAYSFATPVTCSTMSPTNNLVAGNAGSGLTMNPSNTNEPCYLGTAGSSLLLSNFSYALNNGGFIDGAMAEVSTVFTSQVGTTALFQFDPDTVDGSDLRVEFELTGGTITGADLSFQPEVITSGPSSNINEVFCTVFIGPGQDCGAVTMTNPEGNGGVELLGLEVNASSSASESNAGTFSIPYSGPVWVFKDIEDVAGDGFSEVLQSYTTGVPEPVTTSLVGLGLLGFGLLGRRLRK